MTEPSAQARALEALALSSQTPASLARHLRCTPQSARLVLEDLCRAGDAVDAGGVFLRMSAISLSPQALPEGFGFDDDDAPVTEMLWQRAHELEEDEDIDDMPTEVLRVPSEAFAGYEEDVDDPVSTFAGDEERSHAPSTRGDGQRVHEAVVSTRLLLVAGLTVAAALGAALLVALVLTGPWM